MPARRRIDGNDEADGDVLKLILLWGGWCALHSLLITDAVRQWVEGKGGAWLGLYRLAYIAVAVLTLLPVMWYTDAMPQQVYAPPPLMVQMLRGLLLISAVVLFWAACGPMTCRPFSGCGSGVRTGREGPTTRRCSTPEASLPTFVIPGTAVGWRYFGGCQG